MKFFDNAIRSVSMAAILECAVGHLVLREENGKRRGAPQVRSLQTYGYISGESCPSMNNALVPPDDSTCWQWWTPPPSGVLSANDPPPTKGCDYAPCEQAVCECDPYCCESAWDESCRGYKFGGDEENNYFVDKCSAAILCCEPESAYPDIMPEPALAEAAPATSDTKKCFDQYYSQDESCPCMEGNLVPPDDSTCWQWWTPPADGVLSANDSPPTTGCDYAPCEKAVCDCDSYCCDTAWDESCRGYTKYGGSGNIEQNYYVEGCSAAMLCCEPESAFPDLTPVEIIDGEPQYNYYPVPEPVPMYNPVPVPVANPQYIPVSEPNYVLNPVPVYKPVYEFVAPVEPAQAQNTASPMSYSNGKGKGKGGSKGKFLGSYSYGKGKGGSKGKYLGGPKGYYEGGYYENNSYSYGKGKGGSKGKFLGGPKGYYDGGYYENKSYSYGKGKGGSKGKSREYY